MIYPKGITNSVLYCCGGALLCGGYALISDLKTREPKKRALTLSTGIIALLIGPNFFLLQGFRWSTSSLKLSNLFVVMSVGQNLVNLAINQEEQKKVSSEETSLRDKTTPTSPYLVAKKVSCFIIGGFLFGMSSRDIIRLSSPI